MKDTVVFHKDWYQSLQDLSDDERLACYEAVFLYAFDGVAPTDKFIRACTRLILTHIDTYQAKYERIVEKRRAAGRKGAQATNKSRQMPPNASITDTGTDTGTDTVATGVADIEKSTDVDCGNRASYPYQEIAAMWNEVCVSLPKIKSLNDSRRRKIRARLEEWGGREQWLAKARELFTAVEKSDFLSGRSGKWQNCSFDWLFANGDNWLKVSEGNYRNKGEQAPSGESGEDGAPQLGIGEFIDDKGERRYGTGNMPPVPMDAPPRPGSDYIYSQESNTWIAAV